MHPDHPVFLLLHGAVHPAENRLDSCFDFQDVEGLGHVVVGAVFKAQDLIHILALGRQHDDRDIALFTDSLADGNTVQLRQHDVKQNQVVIPGFKHGERFFTVHGAFRFVSFLFQSILQTLQDQRFVINQENPFSHR